ncbi:hypothetical protein [Streptomyces cadmiisoli]|uniref:Peptidase C83 domain-containing protein n=1 Tax=Streptomyces cadmiisoli TaxID=2184053 RepID=A0A2Z4J2C8_9ACTN|nr:hypothetical protein [Streptomyces cadmiisoli]AWW38858.1 hypothetical protein DN051_21205 [Streptomyces cadmiisoli]
MSNQPYQGPYDGSYDSAYQGYDPYGQPPQPEAWPGHQQAYDDPQAAQHHTQQWQGQTWETQTHAPVSAAETAYLPPQAPGHPAPGAFAATGPSAHQPTPGWDHPQQHPAAGWDQQPQPHRTGGWDQHPQQPAAAGPAPAAESESEGPAYGRATLAGNARITDAQRARLEGRSPVIEPGMQPAALTAALGLLLSGAAAIGSYALLVPLVVLQAVTAAGWFRLNGMWPARQGIALAFAGAVVADVALLVAGRDQGPAAILGTLGVWVLLTLVLQLRSHADPDTRMYGLMATVVSAALAVVAAGYLAAEPDAVTIGAAAAAVAVLARALPLPTPASVVVALLAAAGTGIAVGGMTGTGAGGALLGAAAGVCALIGHRVASYDYPSRFVHFTAGVALPLSAAAPVVWVLGRALV